MNAFNFLTQIHVKDAEEGITMMLDKGMGPRAVEDLLQISGDYVDLAKFGWGTSAVHERDIIKAKVETYLSHDVKPYPGGTLFEVAYIQNKFEEFLNESQKLGFEAIEISDGTIDISIEERERIIREVKDNGFMTITEVGKKDPRKDGEMTIDQRIDLVNFDIEAGADKVLIEAREGGKGIGIYDSDGNVKEDDVELFMKKTDINKIIWEAPHKNQQVYMILKFGANVNLGNIPPDEITALETMRMGLRGDTLGKVNLQ
ncbi:phosphosulfolactate synthase [Methanobacterium aggregans]|uniref:phosphosulfolactate synthase n=1 Tax=Methanobacterium aggregans TaxID=1615586 RepID=UPI001AE5BEE6|nr:phosphosulfolactate synthase [Methanobacterium aggregans]MBP2045587.1 phosphosulfolactate synthase [Methanobacterium aggregans]